MRHPARIWSYHEIMSGMDEAVDAGLVTRRNHEALPLAMFTYTQKCVYDGAWNWSTRMARGLIVDIVAKQVVATPFEKFFNAYERATPIPALPFEVFEKVDGSLIILFWYAGQWRCATKGSFTSDQAVWAENFIARQDLSSLNTSATYLCEEIGPHNRIVVGYPDSLLVFLSAYHGDGVEFSYNEMVETALRLKWPLAARFNVDSIGQLIQRAKTLPKSEEGFVVRFSNGYRLKIKGDEYLRLHRAISRLTPLAVWEIMAAGGSLTEYRRELPDEFWHDFDQIVELLTARRARLQTKVMLYAEAMSGATDKQIGLALDGLPADVRPFIFPWRHQNGNLMTGRSRDVLFRAIRPTGNRLQGYEPSGAVNRVMEAAE